MMRDGDSPTPTTNKSAWGSAPGNGGGSPGGSSAGSGGGGHSGHGDSGHGATKSKSQGVKNVAKKAKSGFDWGGFWNTVAVVAVAVVVVVAVVAVVACVVATAGICGGIAAGAAIAAEGAVDVGAAVAGEAAVDAGVAAAAEGTADAAGAEGAAAASEASSSEAQDGVELSLKYKDGWSAAQREAADSKVANLNTAARNGDLRVTSVQRSGSAASRYSGNVPKGSDVDHVVDLQLGGADTEANMAPLDMSVNRSLGSQIGWQLRGVEIGTCVISIKIC